ncbi:MAG: hypothetical protein IPO93_17040 [Actinobacteria bacterium]|jgi:hypothetical protein|nr:hypothetical protein [Actinomycetota bacterium]
MTEGDVTPEEALDAALEADDVLLLDEIDAEPVLPMWEATGEPRVDEALDLLGRLDPERVDEHAEVFDTIHQRLRATLSDLDSATS